jgi:1,4-alpha-glucan branching enzyme
LSKQAVGEAKNVTLVGEFNDWNTGSTPMKKRNDGTFAATLELEPGREYQFRYFVDNGVWQNDENADRFVSSPFGDSKNSVIRT